MIQQAEGAPMILISNYIYIYIVYFIFLFYHISIKYILPIEFRINSMSDKYNIYSLVDVLRSDDLCLLICIRLLTETILKTSVEIRGFGCLYHTVFRTREHNYQ